MILFLLFIRLEKENSVLKIAITVEALKNEYFAGVEQYIYNLTHQLLSRSELDLTLIAPSDFPHSLFPTHTRVIYHDPTMVLGSGFVSAVFFPPKNLSNFDLVHCPTVTAPFFFRPNYKVVMTVHDLIPLLFPKWHTTKHVLYFKYFLKYRFRFVDRFIADSNTTKQDLIDLFEIPEDKIDVVYLGVSDRFRPIGETREDFILAVSTLEPRKNFKRIIEAYISLRKEEKISDKLMIVGKKGWLFDDISTIPRAFQDDIIFKGYVSEDELLRLFQTARFFIYPSMYEGFGLPILEAMACGCPVITSNTSSMPEVAGEAALLVDPYQIEEIKNAIYTLTKDAGLCTKMSAEGIRRASQFSWQRAAEQTSQVYEKALAP